MIAGETTRSGRSALVVAALGVVYGDIGTSPLYAFKESLSGAHGVGVAPLDVLGVLSMIFWAITLVVSIKYVLIVLRADNDGEGGVLALLAGVLRQLPIASRHRGLVVGFGLVGASMFYGDSLITPAISVLSAVEGLEVISPAQEHYVLPLTLGILVALFVVQRFGTGRMGIVFGPVMLLWFATLALLGILQIVQKPQVLLALEPVYALRFALEHPVLMLAVMAAVFLALTGGEALYADMGHFGRQPIRVAWFWIVMPCLLLNYFGQGALVIHDPEAARNPFFLLAPGWLQMPLVGLATAATVIASQAVISGAYSITSQAAKLGYLPRVAIHHTSTTEAGQIYIPVVNWLLLGAVILLVLAFGSSSALAAAYGIAVSTTMVITTLGVVMIARSRWDWSPLRVGVLLMPLLALDLAFLMANSLKIAHGGWFPLAFGAALFFLLATWRRGRELMQGELARGGIATGPFLESLAASAPHRVEGTAVFMTPQRDVVPNALLHNLKHNRVLHSRVVLMSVESENMPHVPPSTMVQIRDLGAGFFHVRLRLGFQDEYDIAHVAEVLAREHGFNLAPGETSFFLSRHAVISGKPGGMAHWRVRLFSWMNRNAQPASDFFRMPSNRVIEIGSQVVI